MTWIVRVALERPYTFLVLAIAILIFGPLAALRMPTDIFPNIGIPVVSIGIQYNGLSPAEIAGRMVTPLERQLPNDVSDIEHIESQSLAGNGIVKIFFQPGVNIATAMAQVTGVAQYAVRFMPPGALRPSSSITTPRQSRCCNWRFRRRPCLRRNFRIWHPTTFVPV